MAKEIRADGRAFDELRSIRIEAGILDRADGSARVEWGLDTKILKAPAEDISKIEELKNDYYIKIVRSLPGAEDRKRVLQGCLPEDVNLDLEGLVARTAGLPLDSLFDVCERLREAYESGNKLSDSAVKKIVDEVRKGAKADAKEWIFVDVPEKLLNHLQELNDYEVVGSGFRGNVAVVAVYGPREPIPRHVGDPYESIIRFRYTMAPFSVPERKRPAPGRREVEISKVCKEALQRVVFAEEFPMTVIDVFAEILAADAGTRVTALTAAGVALADAGIPMRDIPAAVAVGRAFGHIVADLTKFEEDAPDAIDTPMAILPGTEEIALLQMDGRATLKEMDEIIDLGVRKAKEVSELQRRALKEKYSKVVDNE